MVFANGYDGIILAIWVAMAALARDSELTLKEFVTCDSKGTSMGMRVECCCVGFVTDF